MREEAQGAGGGGASGPTPQEMQKDATVTGMLGASRKRDNPGLKSAVVGVGEGANQDLNFQALEDKLTQKMSNMMESMMGTIMDKFNELKLEKNMEPETRVRLGDNQGLRHNQLHQNNQAATTQTPDVDLKTLLQFIHHDFSESRFMQATTLLKPLYGSEGRTRINAYFRHLESITYTGTVIGAVVVERH